MISKQSSLLAMVGAHIAQNVVGANMVKSPEFQKTLAENFIAGASARKANYNTLYDKAKSVGYAVAVPEGALMQNEAYKQGQHLYKALRLQGIDTNRLSKREVAMAHMVLTGKHDVLAARGLHNHPVVQQVRKVMGVGHINGHLNSSVLRNVGNLPMGNRAPHSPKVMALSNVAMAAADPGTAALNGAKLLTEHPAIKNSKVGKLIDEHFVHNPLKEAVTKGAKGIELNPKVMAAKKYLMNGAMTQVEEAAHHFGQVNKSNTNLISSITKSSPKVSKMVGVAKAIAKLR